MANQQNQTRVNMPPKARRPSKWSSQADATNVKPSSDPRNPSSQPRGLDSTKGRNRGRGFKRGRGRNRGSVLTEVLQHQSVVESRSGAGIGQAAPARLRIQTRSTRKRSGLELASSNRFVASDNEAFSQPTLDLIRPVRFPVPSENFGQPHDKPFPFLRLPPELRNKIYELVFASRRVTIKKSHRTEAEVKEKSPNAYTGLIHTQIFGKMRYRGGVEALMYPLPLVLSCRQIYDEALPYMYRQTRFWFGSQKPIRRFLELVPDRALGCIRDLEIYHNTYGEPLETVYRKYKERDDDSWMDVCVDMSKKLTGLKTLRVDYRICDWPVQPTMDSDWAQPILELGESRFEEVSIRLIHPCLEDEHLTACGESMARFMLNESGNKQRLARETIKKQRRAEREAFLDTLDGWQQLERDAMKAAARDDELEAEARRVKSLRITNTEGQNHSPMRYKQTTNGRYEGGYALQGLGEPPNPYGANGLRVSRMEHDRWVTRYIPQNNSTW